MKRHQVRLQTLIATLGSEPQVVTIVLDRLLAEGRRIDQVVVVYTAADVVQAAMARLAGEFDGAVYPGVTLRTAPVIGPDGAVEDLRKSPESVAEFREQAWYTGCRIWNAPLDWTQENADAATW